MVSTKFQIIISLVIIIIWITTLAIVEDKKYNYKHSKKIEDEIWRSWIKERCFAVATPLTTKAKLYKNIWKNNTLQFILYNSLLGFFYGLIVGTIMFIIGKKWIVFIFNMGTTQYRLYFCNDIFYLYINSFLLISLVERKYKIYYHFEYY